MLSALRPSPFALRPGPAVTESRRWKAAVAEKTQAMSRAEVLAFFDKDKALAALAQMRQAAAQRARTAV